jgi:drug/metabolite transporter (DMT)-like permease
MFRVTSTVMFMVLRNITRITETTELLAFFGVGPALAITIAYRSWRGKPRRFNPRLYSIVCFASGVTGFLLLFVAQRPVNVGTTQFFLQFLCAVVGGLLLWVFMACGSAVVLHLMSQWWRWHNRTRLTDGATMNKH